MKIDPMPRLRISATIKVNAAFNGIAADMLHRDHAYRRKREVANAVLRSEELNERHPFVREAKMRGIPVRELALVVVSKNDTIDEREGERQALLMAIDAASTPAELASIVSTIPG